MMENDPKFEQDNRFFKSMCEILVQGEKEVKEIIESEKHGLMKLYNSQKDDIENRLEIINKREKELMELEQRIKNAIIEYDKRIEIFKNLYNFKI